MANYRGRGLIYGGADAMHSILRRRYHVSFKRVHVFIQAYKLG